MRLLQSKVAAATLLFACALARFAGAAGTVNVVELTGAQIKSDLLSHTYTAVDLVQSYLDRIDKFNAKWEALDKEKRDKLVSMEPQSSKEVNDESMSLIISCPGVKAPVK